MSESDRKTFLRKPFLLPADVLIFPVSELAAAMREQLDCQEDDFAVTRPGMRSFSKIVDKEMASLLEEFRRPSPLVDGILRYSRRNNLNPQVVLENVFPALVAFSSASFLVPADSPLAHSVSASYATGQIVAGYEIRRLIQVLQDTELYLAQRDAQTIVALKISRDEPSPLTKQAIWREAVILEHLDGVGCPRLVEYGSFKDRPFLASSWVSGIPISRRAQEIHSSMDPHWRQQLHELCCRLIDAYTALHERRVIHGDIHPRNVLISANDAVTLLDFGLSRINGRNDLDHYQRSGLAWYIEPEVAGPILKGKDLTHATFAGDQYGVAALIYFLICGAPYLTAKVESEALYRQILTITPPPFTRSGFESWPEVEEVLARALSKKPRQRFQSMRDFGDAFRQACPSNTGSQVFSFAQGQTRQKWVDDILKRTAYDPLSYEKLFPQAPTASLYFGAAGLVWFLYRAAQVREEPHLLAAADLWAQRTASRREQPDSFRDPVLNIEQEPASQASVFLRNCGLQAVNALVSYARGDLAGAARQVQAFTASSKGEEDVAELLYGRSGVLVSGALMAERLFSIPNLDAHPLLKYLQEEAIRVWSPFQNLPALGQKNGLPHLGIAHGWAGILYAQLMIYQALHLTPPGGLEDRLRQLAGQAEPAGRGVSWLGTMQHPGQITENLAHAPGWCNGSAGYVFLWTLANEVFQDKRYLELAEKAAWYTWEHMERFPNLCCGLTGRAFALLHFYRYTGDVAWLDKARLLAQLDFDPLDHDFHWSQRTLSLFRGELGPALLAIELEHPEGAVMPMFEFEGWPPL